MTRPPKIRAGREAGGVGHGVSQGLDKKRGASFRLRFFDHGPVDPTFPSPEISPTGNGGSTDRLDQYRTKRQVTADLGVIRLILTITACSTQESTQLREILIVVSGGWCRTHRPPLVTRRCDGE